MGEGQLTSAQRATTMGFGALWAARVASTPDRVALVGEDRTLTVAELDAQARTMAHAMAEASPDPAVPVVVVLDSWVDTVVSNYAGWLAGRGTARLDPRSPTLRLRELIATLEPAAAIVDGGHHEVVGGAEVLRPAELVPSTGATLGEPIADQPESIMFTSGSTGLPKGLSAPFSARDHRIAAQVGCFGYTEADRVGLNLPPSFGASMIVFHAPVWGASLHLLDPAAGARAVARWLSDDAITLAMMSPHLMREVMAGLVPGVNYPALRVIAPVADKVTGTDVAEVRGRLNPRAEVVCFYGSSEAGPISALHVPPEREVPDGPLPIGRPLLGVEWWIDEPDETGAGRIVVRSPCSATHYWRNPGLTDAVFRPDPDPDRAAAGGRVVIGGDYGRLADGDMVFLGRRDAMLKVRGYTIDLSEIEHRLTGLDEVAEAIVSVDEPRPRRVRIVAHVVPSRPGVTVSQLRRGLSDWLPRYMLPGAVVFCERFPRNERDKVIAAELPAPGDGRPSLDRPFVAPGTDLERLVAEVWEQVLGVAPVGLDDDFFDLGGDSLTMVEVTDQIGARLAVDLPIAVFEQPTLGACAAACARWRSDAPTSAILALQTRGAGVPVFCVHGGGGRPEVFLDLANAFGASRPFYGVQVLGLDGMRRLRSVPRAAAAYADALVEACPGGPFVLAGYSGGGTLAVEMARLLAARGRAPELVVLLDAHFVSRLPLRADRLSLRSWLDALRRETKRQIAMSAWAERLPLPMDETNRSLAAEARDGRRRIRLGQPLDTALRRRMVMAEMTTGLGRWVARPYRGSVVALCTAGHSSVDRWRVVAPDLTAVEVPGDHGSFIRPPDVDHLVEALGPFLDPIDGRHADADVPLGSRS